MEDLNKNQIILLVLLVSFVTSIATGIMTVSLLQQAPVEVTRNINSIVEKTLETVTAPANTNSSTPQKEVTTVVVNEEDMIMSAINKNVQSVVRISEKDTVLGTTDFYGVGLVVSKDGFIAADRKTIVSNNVYTASMNDGTEFKLSPTGVGLQTNFILFKAIQSDKVSTTGTASSTYAFVTATLGAIEPQLGQTLIGLGGDTTNAVAVGRVVSLDMKDSGTGTTTTKYLANINTDISSSNLADGSPTFNLSGDIVGVQLLTNSPKSFTPISVLKKELTSLLSEAQKTQ